VLLLDTHAFVWLVSDQSELSGEAKRLIDNSSVHLYFSSISALEIGLSVKRKGLSLPVEPQRFIAKGLSQHGIQEIPVSSEIALFSTKLPEIHNDPFDRIIIATAQHEGLTILSKDAKLREYPNTTVVW